MNICDSGINIWTSYSTLGVGADILRVRGAMAPPEIWKLFFMGCYMSMRVTVGRVLENIETREGVYV